MREIQAKERMHRTGSYGEIRSAPVTPVMGTKCEEEEESAVFNMCEGVW